MPKESSGCSRTSHRNPNLLSHYHDFASRVFASTNARPNEYLHNLFLDAAKNGEYERVENFLMRSARTMPVNVDYKDRKSGNTAIIAAASNSHEKVVTLLLNYGADITLCNNSGQSILDLTHKSLVPLLLDSVERQGISPRHLLQAAWQGNIQILKRLLTSSSHLDVNCKNADGMTPLLLVTRDVNLFERVEHALDNGYNPAEVVQALLEHKANCGIKTREGKQPLHQIAANKGKLAEDITRLLVNAWDSDTNAQDAFNYSPIHWASKEDNCSVILALIDGGAEVNIRGHRGKTPLHVAASHGHERSSSALLQRGADVTVVDDQGCSPMDVTANKSVQRILREAWSEQTTKQRVSSAPGHVSNNTVSQEDTTDTEDCVSVNTEIISIDIQPPCDDKTDSNGVTRTVVRSKNAGTGIPKLVTYRTRKFPPSPPKTCNSSRQPHHVTLSRSKADYQIQRTELPQLSVKNLELQIVRSPLTGMNGINVPRTPDTVRARCPTVQRIRLLNCHSAPVPPGSPRVVPGTPETSSLRSFKGLSPCARVKFPCRIAPLPRRITSPDLRLTVTQGRARQDGQEGTIEESGQETVGQVIDLDSIRSRGSSARSLFYDKEFPTVPPPPSPIDMSRDLSPFDLSRDRSFSEADTRGLELRSDVNGKDLKYPACSSEQSRVIVQEENYNSYRTEDIQSERESKENPSTQEGIEGTGSIVASKDSDDVAMMDDKNQGQGALQAPENMEFSCDRTFTSDERKPTFWIPYKEGADGNTNDDSEVDGTSDAKRTRTDSTSSVSFYVDLKNNTEDASNLSRCHMCGEEIHLTQHSAKSESVTCTNCRRTSAPAAQFWVSLERKNDGTIDGQRHDTFTKKNSEEKDTTLSGRLGEGPLVEKSSTSVKEEPCDDVDVRESRDSDTTLSRLLGEEHATDRSSTFVKEEPSGDVVIREGKATGLSSGANVSEMSRDEGEAGNGPEVSLRFERKTPSLSKIKEDKSDMILQSFSVDEQPSTPPGDANDFSPRKLSETKGDSEADSSSPALFDSCGSTSGKEKEENSKAVQPVDVPDGPKSAWSSPRRDHLNQGSSELHIFNPFPSPVPPSEARPVVKPPMGAQLYMRAGKKGKKAGKDNRSGSASKPLKKLNGKRGKSGEVKKESSKKGKKSKGKKKGGCKEIEVNQSAANFASYGSGFTSSISAEVTDHIASPDVDTAPTMCLEPRTFSGRLLRSKYPALSPIPESPRSGNTTPRAPERTQEPTNQGENILPEDTRQRVEKESIEQSESKDSLGEATEDSVSANGGVVVREQEMNVGGEFDEVDGGLLSRLAGLCIPRLNLTTYDSDSDEEEHLIEQSMDVVESAQGQAPTVQNVSQAHVLVDEADDEIEKMACGNLANNALDIIGSPNQSYEGGSYQILETSLASREDKPSLSDSEELVQGTTSARTDNASNASLRQARTLEYLQQINGLPSHDLEVPRDAFDQEEQDTLTNLSSLSRADASSRTEFSDYDSSYNSLSSTPRTTSDCSSNESSDSYFSSPRNQLSSSLEIDFNERVLGSRVSTDTSNSGSNDSNSTLRAHSGDFTSTRSSENQRSVMVTSRLSRSTTGSQTSAISRGEEIEWQRGNILGKGAFGTVYLGLVNTGELIAVKQVELHPNNIDEAEKQYDKLQEEVALLKSLKHENIVRYIGTCIDDSLWTINIFMEYVPGGSIAQALKRFGALVEPVFRRYTKQIVNGVAYLHENNVIHRDIKGGNIMIMPNGVIKLIDFGCAKRICMNLSLSRSNMLRSMKGTPYWMAPEVIKETGHGRKSDVWSVGCTVYEMATGQPPWSDMPPMSAIFAIGSGKLPVPRLGEGCSDTARDFVSSCMTREEEGRPTAEGLLQHSFLDFPP